ncbi:hypothetical protein BS47DRAFT_774015 [Hydnum rufescens UP504]|uniref:Uncharacterized protein n=1 Tax=Hydnum rufescens UP504 TaxID=1448309 RepID=A0A9P6DYF5_9AGAM|nr:hypothetical protein BS47DRAFT_774015 [Hydnum rufescens UP504]
MASSSTTTTNAWADFNTICDGIQYNTVDRLKSIITGLNATCYLNIPRSGRKQDHIDRIRAQLEVLRSRQHTDAWTRALAVIRRVGNEGLYVPPPVPPYGAPAVPPLHRAPVDHPPPAVSATPAAPAWPRPPAASPIVPQPAPKPVIKFKPSPFYHAEYAISAVVTGRETSTTSDRGQILVDFRLSADDRLKIVSGKHQLRLFCTSSTFHSSSAPQSLWTTQLCPIEFPPVSEIKVNGRAIPTNRGMKKKPGTTPPADVTKFSVSGDNKIEMNYLNNITPFSPKKYFLLVNLVRVSTVEELVERLRSGKTKSAESIKNTLYKSNTVDDDIVAGAQTMSLKCPLSYMRISTPCRSQACVHAQCFDATSWYSMMEQTTTYACPVCDKTLNFEELIMDGCVLHENELSILLTYVALRSYFNEILKLTPESVEDVTVEPDGEWHTLDGKYFSAAWRPPAPPVSSAPSVPSARTSIERKASTPALPHAESDVFIINDDSDEDETRVRQSLESQNSQGLITRGVASKRSAEVIDLTLSSDDERDDATAVDKGKGRASAYGPSASKRMRTEESTSSMETVGKAVVWIRRHRAKWRDCRVGGIRRSVIHKFRFATLSSPSLPCVSPSFTMGILRIQCSPTSRSLFLPVTLPTDAFPSTWFVVVSMRACGFGRFFSWVLVFARPRA